MGIRQDWVFWSLLKQLIENGPYEIIHISGDFQEVWLQANERKPVTIVRLLRQNFPWSNVIEQDIEYVYEKSEQLRKQWFKKELHTKNIYISDYEPVNEWSPLSKAEQMMGKKAPTKVETILVAEWNTKEEYEHLTGCSLVYPSHEDGQLLLYNEHLKQQVITYITNQKKKERELFEYGKPFLAFVLLAAQIVMFLVLEFKGGSENTLTLIEYGAKFNPFIFDGEWWRFITPIFLHIGMLHLLMNSFALYYLGPMVEKMYGSIRFLFIYLFSGFTGVLGSFLFSSTVSAGASGAIFGCFGALLYLGKIHRQLFLRTMGYNIIAVIIVNLIFGFVVPGIDNAGHIGGLVGGFLAASIVSLPKHRNPKEQVLGLVISGVIVIASLLYGFSPKNLEKDTEYALGIAQNFNANKQYDKALDVLQPFQEKSIKDSRIYFLLSYAQIKKNEIEKGRNNLETAVRYDPSFHEAHYNLALIYLSLGEVEKARTSIEKAAKLEPKNEQYQQLLREVQTRVQ
ncbi:rhomboid family intramembrane serine protease [Bacillus songklensis]|uniref:rhomboid family intramembrane serine protease n=1 Tax=Bacillus songklensis TaxID=1069116 RepID=UPI0036709E69